MSATYIAKDIHETLDYIFVSNVGDPIETVTYEQSPSPTMTVQQCYVNTTTVTDDEGTEYPAGSAIVLWVSGGELFTTEKLRLQYTTAGGRTLDADIVFRLVEYR